LTMFLNFLVRFSKAIAFYYTKKRMDHVQKTFLEKQKTCFSFVTHPVVSQNDQNLLPRALIPHQ